MLRVFLRAASPAISSKSHSCSCVAVLILTGLGCALGEKGKKHLKHLDVLGIECRA